MRSPQKTYMTETNPRPKRFNSVKHRSIKRKRVTTVKHSWGETKGPYGVRNHGRDIDSYWRTECTRCGLVKLNARYGPNDGMLVRYVSDDKKTDWISPKSKVPRCQ